jgi:predicted RNase H-like HicB family nuclease
MQNSKKNQFKVLIERDEDGYFIATVPALPGCYTQAKTLTQLTNRIKEAIQLCLDIAKTNAKYRKKIKQFSYEPTFVGMDLVTV